MAAVPTKDGDIKIEFIQDKLKNEYGNTYMAYYDMKKPSDVPNSVLLLNDELPKVCLGLVQPADLLRLSAMQGVNHVNIMRIEAVEKIEIGGQNLLALFVDHHSGPLGVHLDSLCMADNYGVVPSQGLRDIIRQIICGLEELRINGLYHGDLLMNNIYVSKGRKLLIKLFNFQRRDIPKERAQLADFVGLGGLLDQISSGLKLRNPGLFYSAIDHLASALMALTENTSLQTVKEMALQHTFFWDPRRRTIFWIHDVPKALDNNSSVAVINGHTWNLPWTTHQGLLNEMNAHRVEEARKKANQQLTPQEEKDAKYKETEPLHYVRCISGAYTHEDKLKGKIFDNVGTQMTVDAAVQTSDPELSIMLYKLLKDAGIIED